MTSESLARPVLIEDDLTEIERCFKRLAGLVQETECGRQVARKVWAGGGVEGIGATEGFNDRSLSSARMLLFSVSTVTAPSQNLDIVGHSVSSLSDHRSDAGV